MAVGTITRKAVDPHGVTVASIGDLKITLSTVVGGTSYTTGGDAVTAANLGLSRVLFSVTAITAATGTNSAVTSVSYIASTGKLQMFSTDGGAPDILSEVASTQNVSGITVTITAFGY